MRTKGKFFFSCAALFVFAKPLAVSQANEASINAYCLSMNMGKATASVPGIFIEAYFTTYDGASGIPLHDEIGGYWIFGGEMGPVPNVPGAYRSDYIVYGNDSFNSSGRVSATFPTTDSNANGAPDFLEAELNGSVGFTGTLQREIPSSPFLQESFTGQITRAAGAAAGVFTVTIQEEGYGPVVYRGETFVVNATGVMEYNRAQNSANLVVSVGNPDGTSTDYSADTRFEVLDQNTLRFSAAEFQGEGPESIPAFAFTMTRTGNRYIGNVEFEDAGLATSWRDYVRWGFVLQDTNDQDADGIPDLSDSYLVPPTIIAQPESFTAIAGDSVEFSVSVSGTEPITYQWQRNGQDLVGATQHFYTISNVGLRNAGEFRVVISNPAGDVISETATLTVLAPPSIVAGPGSMTALLGHPVEFAVTAGGTSPLSFQWQHNGAAIAGATDATFSIPAVELADQGEYVVIISNSAGIVESSPVLLTIVIPELQFSVESLPNGSFRIKITDNGGLPIPPERQAKLEILATTDLSRSLANWASYSLADYPLEDGAIFFEDPDGSVFPTRFYILNETP